MDADRTSSAAQDRLRTRITVAFDQARLEKQRAKTDTYRRFWEGREAALGDVRVWIAQELARG